MLAVHLLKTIKSKDSKLAFEAVDNLTEDYSMLRLWIDENICREYSGEAIFREFAAKKDEILKDENMNMETRKEVYNILTIDLENFNQLFFEEMRFTSPPSVPKKNIRPKKSVIIIAGFFIGLFLFLFLTVAIEFWAINKESIAEKK